MCHTAIDIPCEKSEPIVLGVCGRGKDRAMAMAHLVKPQIALLVAQEEDDRKFNLALANIAELAKMSVEDIRGLTVAVKEAGISLEQLGAAMKALKEEPTPFVIVDEYQHLSEKVSIDKRPNKPWMKFTPDPYSFRGKNKKR